MIKLKYLLNILIRHFGLKLKCTINKNAKTKRLLWCNWQMSSLHFTS